MIFAQVILHSQSVSIKINIVTVFDLFHVNGVNLVESERRSFSCCIHNLSGPNKPKKVQRRPSAFDETGEVLSVTLQTWKCIYE